MFKFLVSLLIVSFGFHLAAEAKSESSGSQVSILLLGNSVIYFNEGLGAILEKLAASASPPIKLKATQIVKPSESIKMIWDTSENELPPDAFDFVVFQDSLNFNIYGSNTTEELYEYSTKIDKWARSRGGKTVILMDWAPPPFRAELSLDDRGSIFGNVVGRLKIDVAPFGLAWQHIDRERPKMNLYSSDGSHPGRAGTYLMSCVLYATIFKISPVGLAHDPNYISKEDAAYLQNVAWQTCLDYQFAHVAR